MRRMTPVLFGMGVYYVDTLLARRFLSELGVGAQSYFNWALRLCDFPQGIFVMALSSAALPSLSRLVAQEDRNELARTFSFGLRLAMFVAIPATCVCVLLAEPLVVVLFQRGAFDATSAHETARALMAQGAGIWLVAATRQLVALYYALGDTRTPVLVASLDLGAFVVAALLLRGPFGHVGISAAVSIASAVQAALLWLRLGKHLQDRRGAELARALARITLAAAIASCATYSLTLLLGSLKLRAFVGIPTFALTFLLSAITLRCEELEVFSPLLRRVRNWRR
jgi:putative peptidoglycan lipid II flippase